MGNVEVFKNVDVRTVEAALGQPVHDNSTIDVLQRAYMTESRPVWFQERGKDKKNVVILETCYSESKIILKEINNRCVGKLSIQTRTLHTL